MTSERDNWHAVSSGHYMYMNTEVNFTEREECCYVFGCGCIVQSDIYRIRIFHENFKMRFI